MALTASHSSALAEECVVLLRHLHASTKHSSEWTSCINEYVALKLSLVSELVAEIPQLQMQLEATGDHSGDGDEQRDDCENFTLQQSGIVASLALIGGADTRPRLGGTVMIVPESTSYQHGGGENRVSGVVGTGDVCVIRRISARGKLVVQMLETKEVRRLPLSSLRPAAVTSATSVPLTAENSSYSSSFRLDRFMRSDDALRVATSLFALLAQDFRIEKDKWRRLMPTSASNSDGTTAVATINMSLLRQQQQRLAIVKAVRIFFGHQNTLRQILSQPVS